VLLFVAMCCVLIAAIGVGTLLSKPWGLDMALKEPCSLLPKESEESRSRAAALVPPTSLIVGALDTVTTGSTLGPVEPIEPPPVDLSVIGCGDDSSEGTAAVWREVQLSLERRTRTTLQSGGG
jgi:hypothetical protein